MAGTIRELSTDECRRLLAPGGVGRVALSTPVGARIVPVNFTVYRDSMIVFRTTPYSELGTYGAGTDVAFETDNLDHTTRKGWSVVATGRAMLVEDPDEVADIRRTADPWPWADGARSLYMQIAWRELSGRRIEDPQPAAEVPGGRRLV